MKTVAQHIDQLRQLVAEHPALSNAPMNPEIVVEYDPERDCVVVNVVDEVEA